MAVRLILFVLITGIFFAVGCNSESTGLDAGEGDALFVHEILPILDRKCLSCHGNDPDDLRGELDLRTRKAMLRGGVSGEGAVVPGEPGISPLILAMQRKDPDKAMPPKENEALSHDEIELFQDWIEMGAPWPDPEKQQAILDAGDWQYGNRITVATSGGQSEDWDNRRYKLSNLWAFLPLTDPTVPGPEGLHPVDAFVERKLQENQLPAAPRADKLTLIRRATFDLTGLPPSREEIDAFMADSSEQAFAKVVDRLLASPHYGEQWGRHWLDIVRYADTDGFSNDFIRPNAWRYRDYVIRSFNEDKPYDEFIRQQIAGDELDPEDPENLIATGFLRMGPWEHTGMSVAAETRQLFLDDVTNIVGETFLSLPLGCAKCHDHKYDPIPTRDYYRIQAVFAPTQFAERPANFLISENVELMEGEKQRLENWIVRTKEEERRMVAKEERAARAWYKKRGKPYMTKRERRKLPDDQQPPRYIGLTNQDLGYRKVLNKRLQTLYRTQTRFDPLAYSVYNGPNREVRSQQAMEMPETIADKPPATFILGGGSVYAPGEEVGPGVLSAVSALAEALDAAPKRAAGSRLPDGLTERRSAFADWLTRKDQPLTTRSVVNRIWQYHFGKGLAENANNFGATGRQPTHPELLDWLARYFVQHGWSFKAMHRLIMNSEAYQRSSHHPEAEAVAVRDPDNQLLAVFSPRRLGAEEIRDALLLVSGELNPETGGIPVRPEINQEIALQPRHIMGSIAPAYQPSRRPEVRNRRTVYAERYRSLPNPMLEVFNQPSSDLSCERRATSTVTPQVFSLMNSPQVRDRAVALALRLEKEAPGSLEQQIRLAVELIWNRAAKPEEVQQAADYVKEMNRYHGEVKPEAVSYPLEVEREMFEEMTGETFTYTETLDVYADYMPDVKDADIPPATRALADLALVFFNTNEFVYVY